MSLKTWKKEFYPVSASKIKKSDWIGAIEHSILKWEGAKPKSLKAHGLVKVDGFISLADDAAGKDFYFGDSSCALCRITKTNCDICPITIATGVTCVALEIGVYRAWRQNSDPKPMLKALKKTLRHYKKLEKV